MKFLRYIIFVFFFPLFLLTAPVIRAENEFSVDADVVYNIEDNGKTLVTHNITLENNFTNLYATSYTLSLENIDTQNASAKSDAGVPFQTLTGKEGEISRIKVNFPDQSIGKGAQRHFSITYENSTFAVRTGEVWEISIPRLGGDTNFRNYHLTLKVPKGFGLEAYISPKPDTKELTDSGYLYTFSKNSLIQTGISAGYGQFQVFAFNLSYHLENPIPKSSSTEIALPPDTAFQKVYIQKIEPKPANVTIDSDGNWIATYDLSPRQRVDIQVSGSVQIFASYRYFPKPTIQTLNENLQESEYWQINDPAIKELALKLKTPRAIYDYVAQNLKYDSQRVQPNVQRMGALSALANPSKSICMEFTDLFIALSRAAGIPAREIDGFAYTENPDLQPLGLVADVLHSWPEYYDKEKGVWIPVDPTWGATTGGEDFFDKLDLRHFTFVIHGKSAREPYPPGSYKLGPNPQKDVFVSFGQLPENRISSPTVSVKPYRVLPFFSSAYSLIVNNPGPAALYSVYPTVYYDSVEKTKDFIAILPPYSHKQIQVTIPYSFLGKSMPSVIKVAVGPAQAETLTNKKQIVVESLAIILALFAMVTGFIFIKVKKIKIIALFAKIRTLIGKKDAKSDIQTPQDKINT